MHKLTCQLLLIIGLSALSSMTLAAGNAAAGEGQTALCAACHGADGNSAAPNFPKLAGLGEKYLQKQLMDIRDGNRAVLEMTGMLSSMTDQDLADIAAYYTSKPRALSGARQAGLDKGERVYRGGNIETGVPACTGCHSPAGNGNAPAGYPALGGQHAAYIAKQLRAFRAGAHDPQAADARTNDGDTRVMRGVAAQMNDVEIEAVANYISGLH